MATLTICRGLPASGKTSWTRDQVRTSGNTIRINRDDLRAMGFESKWTPRREEAVVAVEKAAARAALACGQNVIIDDTNLRERDKQMWSALASAEGAKFYVNDLRHVAPQECIHRDLVRSAGQVGPGVIWRMAAQNGLVNFGDSPIVICDVDGTCADLTHRLHFNEAKNHEAFFAQTFHDTPIWPVIERVRELKAAGHFIATMSGRPDNIGVDTALWLSKHGVPSDCLLMRRAEDHRPDDQIKAELLALLPRKQVVLAIDDRPRIQRLWEREGIPCEKVNAHFWEGKVD